MVLEFKLQVARFRRLATLFQLVGHWIARLTALGGVILVFANVFQRNQAAVFVLFFLKLYAFAFFYVVFYEGESFVGQTGILCCGRDHHAREELVVVGIVQVLGFGLSGCCARLKLQVGHDEVLRQDTQVLLDFNLRASFARKRPIFVHLV